MSVLADESLTKQYCTITQNIVMNNCFYLCDFNNMTFRIESQLRSWLIMINNLMESIREKFRWNERGISANLRLLEADIYLTMFVMVQLIDISAFFLLQKNCFSPKTVISALLKSIPIETYHSISLPNLWRYISQFKTV